MPASFFDREADVVARELLGAELQHDTPDGVISGRIVETEAYLGPHDPASHSAVGRTPRTWHMFGPPGTAYVYFIYGMHWCVNAVTREDGYGAAVLIRALEPLRGIEHMRRNRSGIKPRVRPLADRDLCNGPGKLCAALGIDRTRDGASLTGGSPLTIVAGLPAPDHEVLITPRIGISRAVEWPLRFVLSARGKE
ncbi:MAG: DNA-3-methyladenine glycosylase [Gemmatimonadaceae bacterium]|nr:DNA-3-methyladenine glycosylase [Gemmatimonadaceae bacterium]